MPENLNSKISKDKKVIDGFLSGGGEMGKLIQEFTWERSSLGAISTWPQSLKTTLSIIVKSKFPMVLLWGDDYLFFYNDAYRPSLGNDGKHPRVLGTPASEIWKEAWDSVKQLVDKVYINGDSFLLEDQLIPIYRDGKYEEVYWTFSYSPLSDDHETTAGVFITCMETTEKVNRRKIFEENSRSLELALEIAELGVFKIDLINDEVFFSHQIRDFFGLEQQIVSLNTFFDRIHQDDKDFVIDVIQNTIAGEGAGKHDLIYKINSTSGNEFKYLHSIGQVIFSEGKAVSISGIIKDVSKQILSQKILEDREKAFRNLVMQAPVAIAVFRGPEFIADIVNDAYLPLVGKSREEFVGKPVYSTLSESRAVLEPIIRQVMNSGKPFSVNELELKIFRGGKEETCWFNSVWEPFFESPGNPDGFMMVAHEVTEQVIARKKIEESEERYRTLIEKASVATALYMGRDLRIRYANDILLGYWGKDKSVIGKPLAEAVPELENQPFLKYLDDVFTTGESYEGFEESANLLQGGILQTRYFNFTYKALRDKEGKIYGIHQMAIDVTGEVMAKRAVTENEEQLRIAIEGGELGTYNFYIQEGVAVWSSKTKEFFGLPADVNVTYDLYLNSIHPEDREKAKLALQQAMSPDGNGLYENEYRTIGMNDGKIRWIRPKGKVIFDESGKPLRVTGIIQDITEKKIAEEALKESEERFRSLADQSPMFVFIVEPGPEAKMSYFNKTWLKYTGSDFQTAILRPLEEVIHPEDIAIVHEQYSGAYNSITSFTIHSVRVKRYDGIYRWHMFKGNPRHLANGEFIGFVGVGIDIHEQKIAQEQMEMNNLQLKKINNDLDNFIYTASHDLKAPMSNIEGLLNALRNSFESASETLNNETETLLELMEQSVNRFKTTILDLTEISKVQRDQDNDFHDVNLDEIISDVKFTIQDKIKESKAEIEVDLSEVNKLRFSRKNIKSIIYNLMSNAIKYRDVNKSAKILIKTYFSGQYTVLSIQDNGMGIPENNLDKVFTMFKRFHDHVEGTGIGLYIVKRIVDNSGGKIEVFSEVGQGTIFKVYFLNIPISEGLK